MIARAHDEGLLILKQHDHAMLTMPLAEAWSAPVSRRDETALAAGEHDNGWIEWDAAPRVDAGGAPYTYRSVPTGDYEEVWRRGFARARKFGDWPGLLVSLHGTRFFRKPELRALLDEERAWEAETLHRLGWDTGGPDSLPGSLPREVAEASDLVAWLDGFSLFLCERWESPWEALAPGLGSVTATRVEEDEVALDPWPFRRSDIVADVPAVRVTAHRFDSDDALREAISSGEPVRLRWRLRPK